MENIYNKAINLIHCGGVVFFLNPHIPKEQPKSMLLFHNFLFERQHSYFRVNIAAQNIHGALLWKLLSESLIHFEYLHWS